jgi:hypothetical protein
MWESGPVRYAGILGTIAAVLAMDPDSVPADACRSPSPIRASTWLAPHVAVVAYGGAVALAEWLGHGPWWVLQVPLLVALAVGAGMAVCILPIAVFRPRPGMAFVAWGVVFALVSFGAIRAAWSRARWRSAAAPSAVSC